MDLIAMAKAKNLMAVATSMIAMEVDTDIKIFVRREFIAFVNDALKKHSDYWHSYCLQNYSIWNGCADVKRQYDAFYHVGLAA